MSIWPYGGSDPDAIEFFTKGDPVHVLEKHAPHTIVDMLAEPGEDFDATAINLALGHCFVGRCGTKMNGAGTPQGPYTVSHFNDNRLCVRCMRATPEAERHRLFEHPQDEDEEDDDDLCL